MKGKSTKKTKKTSAKVNPAPKMTAQDRKWQAESDARTLMAAEEIKASRARLAAAKAHATKQAQAISKVTKL